jgi:hypothetical protein
MGATKQPNRWTATTDKAAGEPAPPAHAAQPSSPSAVEGDEGLETALLSALAAQELGEATEEFDLTTLTPAEREALLRMLRDHLGGSGRG